VLAVHWVQPRSTLAEGTVLTCVPAAQVDQSVQLNRFVAEVYFCAGQSVQVRSVVADPASEMYLPATHVVLSTHTVAGSASSSQVVSEQATAGSVPPAQYWPASQSAHTALLVDVAGAVWTVPA
jgi:hypothetical protein